MRLLLFLILAFCAPVSAQTISYSGTSATVTGQTIDETDSRFTYYGAAMAAGTFDSSFYVPGGVWNGFPPYQVEFQTDSTAFEIYINSSNASGATAAYFRLWVDGTLVSASPTVNAGQVVVPQFYKVSFAARGVRLIKFEMSGFTWFGGVRLGANDSFFKANTPRRKRCIVLGDSFTEGTAASNTFIDYVAILGRLTGWDCWQSGSGGTGYLNAGPDGFNRKKYRDRVTSDIVNQSPDVVIVTGGLNDQSYTSNQIQTEAALLFDAITAGLPNARLIVVAPFGTGTPTSANLAAVRTGVLAAANARSLSVIDPLSTGSEWITGVYNNSASGNAYVAISQSDGVHPTDAGHEYLAKRIYAELVRLGLN